MPLIQDHMGMVDIIYLQRKNWTHNDVDRIRVNVEGNSHIYSINSDEPDMLERITSLKTDKNYVLHTCSEKYKVHSHQFKW